MRKIVSPEKIARRAGRKTQMESDECPGVCRRMVSWSPIGKLLSSWSVARKHMDRHREIKG
jgi:hypothetical protein